MCKFAVETELEKIFMEQSYFEKEYITMLKEKFSSNNKQLKRLILSSFINHISNDESLALFDEDIFNIYKTIIDNYIIFLNKVENIDFKFNKEVLKNLSGITSVFKSQVSFFCDDKDIDINPIYTEKKTITAKYIDNIYKNIDSIVNNSFNNININSFFCDDKDIDINPIYTEKKTITAKYIDNIYKNIDSIVNNSFNNININRIKECFIKDIIDNIIVSYKKNLIDCFNAIK